METLCTVCPSFPVNLNLSYKMKSINLKNIETVVRNDISWCIWEVWAICKYQDTGQDGCCWKLSMH